MSDIVKALRNHGYIPLTTGPEWRYMTLPVKWVEEAADEIERLRVELDYWKKHSAAALDRCKERCAERDALRAKRDALHAKCDELRNECNLSMDAVRRAIGFWQQAADERDALLALLREAREYTGYAAFYGDRIEADHAVDLCARIDTALNKGGGDG